MIAVDQVPDEAILYHRVHVNFVKHSGGHLRPNCFSDKKGVGLSTDWDKYSTAAQTRLRPGPEKAVNYGIVGFNAGAVRHIQQLTVAHSPTEDNDAHTDIFGLSTDAELLTAQRAELYDACGRRFLIEPGSPLA